MSVWLTYYVCTELIFKFTFQNVNICVIGKFHSKEQHVFVHVNVLYVSILSKCFDIVTSKLNTHNFDNAVSFS